MASFAQISDAALDRVDEIALLADSWAQTTLSQMQDLAIAANNLLTQLDGVLYSPTFTESLDYLLTMTEVDEPDYSTEVGPAPTPSALNPVGDFAYSETPYTDLVRDELQTSLQSTLAGSLIVSTGVWDALWDRVVADLGIVQVAEEWQASELGASLGWEQVSETTLARLDAAEDNTSKNLSAQRLEKAIQESLQRREDLWNAVQNGIALEKIHQDLHKNVWDRALSAAIATVDQTIKINDQILEQDKTELALYLGEWDGVAKRVAATAQMMQARISNRQLLINSEQARLGYETGQLNKAFKAEDGEIGLEIERAKLAVENSINTLSSLANIAAGITQGALAASDVNVGTSANINENWSIDGPI